MEAPLLHSFVPQRRSAKLAEEKLKQNHSQRAPITRITPSPSPARSNASRSRSTSRTTPTSSASSAFHDPPPTRNKSNGPTHAPHSAPTLSDRESSLSEESDVEDYQDTIIHIQPKPLAVNSSVPEQPPIVVIEPEISSATTDIQPIEVEKTDTLPVQVEQSQPEPPTSHHEPPSRGSSKRSAARAAQDNIQRSYSYFAAQPTDAEWSAPQATKKSRTSTSRPKSSEHSPTDAEFHAPKASKPRSKSSNPRSSGAASQPPNPARRFKDDNATLWELQYSSCQSTRYALYRRCSACISKRAGDMCRFMGFRAFAIDPATDDIYPPNAAHGPKPALLSSPDPDDVMQLASKRPLSWNGLFEALAIVGKSLLPVLEAELVHARLPDILRRPREKICRQMCEFCATSIFSASWFCRRCGKEYCSDCKHTIDHKQHISDATIAKRMTSCGRTRDHSAADFAPLTRFDAVLLEQEIDAMRAMMQRQKPSADIDTPAQSDAVQVSDDAIQSHQSESEKEEAVEVNWDDIPADRAGLTADNIVGSLKLRTFDSNTFDSNTFRCEWAHGEPLLVRNVATAMQHTWDPQQLIDRYGEVSCAIVRSDTDPPTVKEVSVGKFFSTFGKDSETKQQALGQGSWKLKDWPPSAEFKVEFPELYEDFNRAVPAPEYTSREGVLNLGSCYPTGVIQPDLGPKMYNAWPASEGKGGNGTTRLHMDIADAVNIMLYAATPTRDDVPEEHRSGVAAWDIFRAEDSDALRAFLREEHAKLNLKDDPIHTQRFFISAPQRVKLWRKYGVKSWRIYQKAGEAVFIPAGCAHQVCNLTDCIKVAVDFVSPQNVERCFKLTAEFRGLVNDYKKAWKEDVLSLRTTLWYAWCTYREMDNKGPNVWAAEQAHLAEKQEVATVSKMVSQVE